MAFFWLLDFVSSDNHNGEGNSNDDDGSPIITMVQVEESLPAVYENLRNLMPGGGLGLRLQETIQAMAIVCAANNITGPPLAMILDHVVRSCVYDLLVETAA